MTTEATETEIDMKISVFESETEEFRTSVLKFKNIIGRAFLDTREKTKKSESECRQTIHQIFERLFREDLKVSIAVDQAFLKLRKDRELHVYEFRRTVEKDFNELMDKERISSPSNNQDDDNSRFTDLSSIVSTSIETQKRKMRPPGVSDRYSYSYEHESNADNPGIELLGDSAENDAQVFVESLNSQRYQPEDPEGKFEDDRQMGARLGVTRKGQGFTQFEETTLYPGTNKRTTVRLI